MLFSVSYVSPGNITIVYIKELDRTPEGLHAMLCEMQCNALWAVHVLILPGKGVSMQRRNCKS